MNNIEQPCPRLNDGNTEDYTLDTDRNSNSIVKINLARPYLIDTVRITESGDGGEVENMQITFSDGSSHWVSKHEKGLDCMPH